MGSNLLVRDGGIPGLVVCLAGRLTAVQIMDDGNVRVESGVTCARLARFSADAGLAGGEFFAGIPGSVGGALAMNAGAHDGSTWEQVVAVETIDRLGIVRIRQPDEFEVGYRSVRGVAGEWFVAAHLQMISGTQALIREQIREILRWRKRAQPLDQASAGSVFRNPDGDYAARLIDTAGLKGRRVGGAMVSEKHANFIVNDGTASAADIERLIESVRDQVQRDHGIELKLEVHIVGVPL
ncbi:MAG: UDP-N-acetylenolpyruvoylglucosamine reductase [Gammaproteobacteria bacterium]|nr:MAG: UDP-N-acetylenolpyruvoylglucosamine reductase [Gammaproteobacteria bacterium]